MGKIIQEMRQWDQFLISVCFLIALYEVKASDLQFSYNIFQQLSTWHAVKANYINFQIVDPEICTILSFQKRVQKQFFHHISSMTFQEKCFSCYYILLTDQISLSCCLVKLLGNMCIAIVYFPRCDVINYEINVIFSIRPFFYIIKKSRQKFKYLENEKSY